MSASEQENVSRSRRNLWVLAVVLCVFPALILGALQWFMASARKQAAADPAIFAAQSSAAVVARLGTPIVPAWPIQGWARSQKGNGAAQLTIGLSGPKGLGTLTEIARQQARQWRVCQLEFAAESGSPIQLISDSSRHCTP